MNASLALTALFNGAWQGAVLCTLAVLVFRLFRRLNATTMFAVWSVLLAIAVLLPFANYAFAPKPYRVVHHAVARANPAWHADTAAQRSNAAPTWTAVPQTQIAAPSAYQPEAITRAVVTALHVVLNYSLPILALLALIALIRVAILGRDVIRMLLARTRVRPIDPPVALSGDIGRRFAFAASSDFSSPCVLGFAPALIVIPEDLLAHPDAQLHSVVLHEREHVRRFDDIQNVAQRFIGAIAFFCPGVRIALRELALYREQICDDAAVNATGDRVSYAMTLTGLAQWAQGRGTPVPSLIFKRKHLLHRLEVLLDSAVSHSMDVHRRFAIGAATVLAVAAVLVLRVQVPVVAETFEHPAKAAPVHLKHIAVPKPVHAAKGAPAVKTVWVARADKPAKPAKPVQTVKTVKAVKIVKTFKAVKTVKAVRIKHKTALEMWRVHPVALAYVGGSVARTTVADVHGGPSDDLLDALAAAGMQNLPVDQLIALRDHGVTSLLVRSAVSYFGRVSANDLVYLADHGVGTQYIDVLRNSGVRGIGVRDAVQLMDHGVTAPLIRESFAYFTTRRPQAKDLTFMADHGVTATFLQSLAENHVTGICWEDAVDMIDHGVDATYVARIRRMNPHASISDIIRLRDNGF
jgi:beta-lactamase regulating signal transducer with metallopeptidase domain